MKLVLLAAMAALSFVGAPEACSPMCASAYCADGTRSFSVHACGTCSHHGGIG